MEQLKDLHDNNGILFEDFIEKTFGWHRCDHQPHESKDIHFDGIDYYVKYQDIKLYQNAHSVKLASDLYVKFDNKVKDWVKIDNIDLDQWESCDYVYHTTVYNFPWIGILHNPPKVPYWFDYKHSPNSILTYPELIKSLEKCEGIFVLSDYLKTWLTEYFKNHNINVPVNTLLHPTETPEIKFTWKKFKDNNNRKLVQNGYWLRNMSFIWDINTSYNKVWLYSNKYSLDCLKRELIATPSKLHNELLIEIDKMVNESSTIIGVNLIRLSNEEYDQLLSENICILNLYDSSCNNAIIECIVRNTPIIVNKIESVVEYLGENYPLYFTNIKEAEDILKNKKMIKKGYKYIKSMDKSKLTGSYFRKSFMNSEIYLNLQEKYATKYEYQYEVRTADQFKCSSGSFNL